MNVKIGGLGVCLPERVVTNFDLEKIVDTSDEWITTRTGIKERRLVDKGVETSDLAAQAAKEAMEKAGVSPEDIDLIILGTASPDKIFPATACYVQDKIGAKNAFAFDISAGCTSFIYALIIASQFIQTGFCKNVLIIGAEILSKYIDWTDRSTCVIFADGAGAAVLQATEEENSILAFSAKSDGKKAPLLYMDRKYSETGFYQDYIKMFGNEIFKSAVRSMSAITKDALGKCSLTTDDINVFVCHQANLRIIKGVGDYLHIPEEKVFVNIDKYGNTSAASLPIALYEAQKEGRLKKGDLLVITAFGAGLTWGSVVIRW